MPQQEKIFAQGMVVKDRRPGTPEWVKANVAFNVQEFIQTLQQNEHNGWVNVVIKKSQNGKLYCEVDDYQKRKAMEQPPQQQAPQQGYAPAPAAPQYDPDSIF